MSSAPDDGSSRTTRTVRIAADTLRRIRRRAEFRLRTRGWSPHGLAREDVVWMYRLLLERDPETEATVREKLELFPTLRELRQDIMRSAEFREMNPDSAVQARSAVVLCDVPPYGHLYVDLADEAISVPILRGVYEPHESTFLAAFVKRGMRVIDVGANLGYYSLIAGRLVGPEGRVDAFEPLRRNADLLERSMQVNDLGDVVTVHRVALSDRASRASLVMAADARNSGGAYLTSDRSATASFTAEEVDTARLDDLGLPGTVDLIKLDVEGAERLVLEGAEATIRRDRPRVLCELHGRQLRLVSRCEPADIIVWFEQHGYICRSIGASGLGRRLSDIIGDAPETVAFVPD